MSPSWLNKLLKHGQQSVMAPTYNSSSSLTTSTSLSTPIQFIGAVADILNSRSTTIEPDTSANLDVSATPRIFALVVAIDTYKSQNFYHLTGCKHDGERFIHFLTSVLGVPPSQIMFLADENATQRGVLHQFDQFLIKNADIQRDDAIVFFFAGHGSQPDAPPGWLTENNKIETLCPHDVHTIGEDGEMIWGISDRAIDALMRTLAVEKGDNIVAVFDCCHSGGLARGEEKTHLRVRSIPPPSYPPPVDLNREIWSSVPESCARAAHTVVQQGFQCKAMASHVLLAACRPGEPALEDPAKDVEGGLFTTALIECLRRSSLHDTSYAKLSEMLDLKNEKQHPQCEGMNKDRLLFSVNTLRDGKTTFKVTEKKSKLYVSAGSIHGVVVGTEFSIRNSAQMLVLKAKKVGAFGTMLEGTHHNITDGQAVVTHWHHPTLRVHSPIHHSSPHVIVVPTNEPAEVALHQKGYRTWELERFDPLISRYADRSIQFNADAERMRVILDTIANFNSYLYRSDGALNFAGKVKIRLNRIEQTQREYAPVGDDLLDVPISSQSGVEVKEAIITDLGPRYGFTLENSSDLDLFPYFFYFDPSDYGIQAWYIPPSATMLAPLGRSKADGTRSLFALGYGGFGTDPIEFYLPPRRETDSGFLKIFLTTTYVDMNNVAQSPISEISGPRGLRCSLKGAWHCETFVLTCGKA